MKRILISFICLILAVGTTLSLSACGSSIEDDWGSIIVGKNLPTPQKGKLRIGSNLDNGFFGGIEKVDLEYFNEYKKQCIDMGYTIDSNESGSSYEAFNTDGYDLSLYFINDGIDITLQAPEKLDEIIWPTTGIGAKLPTPVSSLGKITSDSSDCFRVTLGDTTIDDYNNYVKTCEENGFNVDYNKQEDRYEAKNKDGYRLNISYLGCNRIDILIQSPKEDSTKSDDKTSIEDDTKKENSNIEVDNNKFSSDFKQAMNDYEAFIDEYVDFMKKYAESDGSDLTLLADYADYLQEYADMVESFEKWEDEDLNDAELTYYIEVQSRVSQKLLEVAQ